MKEIREPDAYTLYEDSPAGDFHDAHLLGNGHLGASVFGGVPYEAVLINHDTLWSGQEREKINPGTRANIEKARSLVMAGKLREANTLINDEMLGFWSESYLPLGFLRLTFGHINDQRGLPQRRRLLNEAEKIGGYRRELFLGDATERVSYCLGEDYYTREFFVSKPDNVVAIRLTAPQGKLDFSLCMDSPLRHEQFIEPGKAAITGRAPDRVEPYEPHFEPRAVYRADAESDSIRFAAAAIVAKHDGSVYADEMRTYITGASEAVIFLAADTNYAGYKQKRNRDAAALKTRCEAVVSSAADRGWENVRKDHLADYQAHYGRVSINLGAEITGALPTSRRLERFKSIEDNSLQALIAQYARYLLISFSRAGTQAGNLQGIWNPSMQPSWASNYTTNINVQMNYWCAEALGLGDLHLPMTDLIRECADSGKKTARDLYGAGGWVTHHNTDLWRMTGLAGENSSWAWWPFGGLWLCNHLWQHYEYSLDRDYLEDIFPILKGAAEFIVDFVVKGEDGCYYTPPSTSPENKFFFRDNALREALNEVKSENRFSESRDDISAICRISTMDIALITEVFTNLIKAAGILGREKELGVGVNDVLENLYPFKIGRLGQLQEWDMDYEECTPGMGHVSHLYSVYPSSVINGTEKGELFRAAYNSFLRRIQHGAMLHGHWPGAWGLCLAARFRDTTAGSLLYRCMTENLGANMLTRNTCQIDAVMGWAAGIAESLAQSHEGCIHILPALPPSWRNGAIRGIRARGGYSLDIEWRDGKLAEGFLRSIHPGQTKGPIRIKYGDCIVETELPPDGEPVRFDTLF